TAGKVVTTRHPARVLGYPEPNVGLSVVTIQPLDCPVCVDRTQVGGRPAGEEALRLAQCVAEQPRCAPMLTIRPPPGPDRVEHLAVRRPAINGEPKRALGDERVAAHELERRARRIRD